MTRPRAAYHHGNLREVLVETGLKVIEKHGVAALTLREIGAQAGVSRTAAYRHFASKEDLLCAISEAGFALFRRDMETAMAAAPAGFPGRLRATAVAYARFALRHRARFTVMFDAARPREPECETPGEGDLAYAQLEGVIRGGQETGEVRAGDTKLLAEMVWAHIHGISTLRLAVSQSGELDEAFLHRMSNLLLVGIAGSTVPGPVPGPVPRKRKKP